MMKRLLAFASLVALCGCVSDMESDETEPGENTRVSKSEINAGDTVLPIDAWRQYVVLLKPWINGALDGCTGTLVASNWVLTANHCIDPSNIIFNVYNSLGMGVDPPQASIAVFRHPEAQVPFNAYAGGYVDVALVKIAAPIVRTAAKGWTASPTVYSGQSLLCYGFGFNTRNPFTGAGVLRRAFLNVNNINGDHVSGNPSLFDSRRFKILQNANNQIQLPGDSGGPCFDIGGGTGHQVGIMSTNYGFYTGAEQVKFNYVRQWVIDTISNN